MNVPTTARDESRSPQDYINNTYSSKTNGIRSLLIFTVFLSFSLVGKSFQTIDNAIFYTSADSESPEIQTQQNYPAGPPSVDYVNKDESVESDVSRRMEATSRPFNDSSETQGLETTAPTKSKEQQTGEGNERMAIVMRSMDPIKPNVLERLIQIAEILQKEEFENYDFHIMVDQTKKRTTTTATLHEYFRSKNAGHLNPPAVFGVTERMILDEFPKLANGYVKGPLVDGKPGTCCGQPLMWQLLMPTFVTFVHYHQKYDYTWVFEDDLWTVGMPIVELLRTFDTKLHGKNASLVGSHISTNGIPYTKMTKERHTFGFRDVLISMKATAWQHNNRTLLKMDGQTRSQVWNEWGGKKIPAWSCMSDTVYRHSRDFGNYVYSMVKSDIYQFAECYQMPLAWYGGFQIADIKTILPNIDESGRIDEPSIHLKWEDVAYNRKLTVEQAEVKLADYQQTTNASALIYHEMFMPPSGDEFRTKRKHPKLCSLSFDFRHDVVIPADCEKTLEQAAMQNATGVICIGNNAIFKMFQNFLASKNSAPYQVLMDDKNTARKNANYYQYPPVNQDEWIKKTTKLRNRREIFQEKPGTGVCKRCRQTKLKSTFKNLTLESLLVETSRDFFFPTQTTETSQETVAKWISEHYHDPDKTVCIIQMNALEMIMAPRRTKSEYLEHIANFYDLLKPSCGTFIQFGILPYWSTRSPEDLVSWDEGLRDFVLDDNTINGYFIDVSKVKKSESNKRFTKPLWQMFGRLMGLPSADLAR